MAGMTQMSIGGMKRKGLLNYLAVSLLSLVLQVSVLGLLDIFLPGLSVKTLRAAFLFVLILGVANSFFLPLLVNYAVRFRPLLFPIFVFLMNGILVILVTALIPGVAMDSIWTAIGVSIVISMTGMIAGVIFSTDDYASYERFVVQPLIKRYENSEKTDVPGVMFLEIDGLSREVLDNALMHGYMPTLKRWLESGSHKLAGWETDLSCQTGGCQPGILHGHNTNIPAFRWYEKENGRILTSGKPRDVAEIEKRISDGKGLLANHGASRANMYSGDAVENILTLSTVGSSKRNTMEYFLIYANPYMASRTFGIFISHFIVEVVEGWWQLVRNERPRVERTGAYPFQRAVMSAILREISVFTLVGDMLRGLPSMYATFAGYDEVAHHSGIMRKDALRVLTGLDRSFEWLKEISEHAARPYEFVILSDHGQSNGATFLQRTGKTLEQVIKELVNLETYAPPAQDETWVRINTLVTDVSRQNTRGGRLVSRTVKNKMEGGDVVLGPKDKELKAGDKNKVIVLASGNLGLIYFTAWDKRMSLEQINQAFPGLIPGLFKYPQVGLVLVRSEEHGPLVLGSKGVYYLESDRFDGENPLTVYGPNAALHLKREDSFVNAPDLLINSFYNPETGEVAAFEELVGSHGGLGGSQSHAILIHPTNLMASSEPIIGASHLHQVIKQWVPEK
jgi:putative membrane protein